MRQGKGTEGGGGQFGCAFSMKLIQECDSGVHSLDCVDDWFAGVSMMTIAYRCMYDEDGVMLYTGTFFMMMPHYIYVYV